MDHLVSERTLIDQDIFNSTQIVMKLEVSVGESELSRRNLKTTVVAKAKILRSKV